MRVRLVGVYGVDGDSDSDSCGIGFLRGTRTEYCLVAGQNGACGAGALVPLGRYWVVLALLTGIL